MPPNSKSDILSLCGSFLDQMVDCPSDSLSSGYFLFFAQTGEFSELIVWQINNGSHK
jgi:hypothetical protein